MAANTQFIPLNIAVLTVSDSRDESTDSSGDLLVQRITDAGHMLYQKQIVKDDRFEIRAVLSAWILDVDCAAVVLTGGTGVTGRDGTPEAISPLFDKTLGGFGELFRMLSYDEIGASTVQSRALAGVANGTLLFALPGSNNACKLGWDKIIQSQLDARTKPCNFVALISRMMEH
ncbi:MAG: molybdenum cofactor biosynthesis protein B [Arenicellales bacterium]